MTIEQFAEALRLRSRWSNPTLAWSDLPAERKQKWIEFANSVADYLVDQFDLHKTDRSPINDSTFGF